MVVNEYIDPINYDDPIHTESKYLYYITLNTNSCTLFDLYIKNNTFQINNCFIFDNLKEGNYYETTEHLINTIIRNFVEFEKMGQI